MWLRRGSVRQFPKARELPPIRPRIRTDGRARLFRNMGAVSRFVLDLANGFLKSKPLLRDDPFTQRRDDRSQLSNESVSAAFVERAAILRVQTRDSLRDQWFFGEHDSEHALGHGGIGGGRASDG